jgi:DNA-binding transcriptional MocR family regulator
MLKAVLRKGVIVPLEPLPPEWQEGAALEVSRTNGALPDIDAWAQSMNQLCADSPAEDEETMRRAIEEHRRQAKEQMRREMGLSA